MGAGLSHPTQHTSRTSQLSYSRTPTDWLHHRKPRPQPTIDCIAASPKFDCSGPSYRMRYQFLRPECGSCGGTEVARGAAVAPGYPSARLVI
jgi:hypothetical protein